jgi:hypothetical protein
MRLVRNPTVLWRRTATSVVLLPPGGEPTELIGPAVAVWDAVSSGMREEPAQPSGAQTVGSVEAQQIVGALVELGVLVAS